VDQPLDLRDYLSILWGRKWTILAIAAVTAAVALGYSFAQTPVYTSSAQVLVLSSTFASAQSPGTSPPLNMTKEEQVANSAAVQERALERLEQLEITPGTMSASEVEFAETLVFTSESPDPKAAQATARLYAAAYLDLRRSNFLRELEGARRPYESQIEAIDAGLEEITEALRTAKEGERELLIAQYAHLLSQRDLVVTKLNDLVAPGSVEVGRVLRSADLPGSPSAPSHARNGLLGVVVGLALGMGVAFLRERLDEPLRSREELESQLHAPVLGFIPSAGWERSLRSTGRVTAEAAEAFRALRVRLLHALGDRDITSIVITSSLAGEGKTSVTANLAAALATAGNRVAIVAADLRRPQLQTYFGGSDGGGVTEVLPGTRQPQIVISTTGTENLWVLYAGRETESLDPTVYLGSEPMRHLLAELGDTMDFVLVDTPPLLASSDVIAVAPLADAVVLVVDPHLARRSSVVHARRELDLLEVPLLGVIVNKHEPSLFRGYGFGYAYHVEDQGQGSLAVAPPTLRAITAEPDEDAQPSSPARETGDASHP
jgi:capsular exopolysaccharide synthesis family protein